MGRVPVVDNGHVLNPLDHRGARWMRRLWITAHSMRWRWIYPLLEYVNNRWTHPSYNRWLRQHAVTPEGRPYVWKGILIALLVAAASPASAAWQHDWITAEASQAVGDRHENCHLESQYCRAVGVEHPACQLSDVEPCENLPLPADVQHLIDRALAVEDLSTTQAARVVAAIAGVREVESRFRRCRLHKLDCLVPDRDYCLGWPKLCTATGSVPLPVPVSTTTTTLPPPQGTEPPLFSWTTDPWPQGRCFAVEPHLYYGSIHDSERTAFVFPVPTHVHDVVIHNSTVWPTDVGFRIFVRVNGQDVGGHLFSVPLGGFASRSVLPVHGDFAAGDQLQVCLECPTGFCNGMGYTMFLIGELVVR